MYIILLKFVNPQEVCTIVLPLFTWGLMLNDLFRVAEAGFGSSIIWPEVHALIHKSQLLPSWMAHERAKNERILKNTKKLFNYQI